MAKKEKVVKKENLVVKSKVHALVKNNGIRTGGDFYVALSDRMHVIIQEAIQKVQAEGRKKTLNATDLVA